LRLGLPYPAAGGLFGYGFDFTPFFALELRGED
jgi:hypothetical protein